MKQLVKGLPAEMEPVKISLHGNLTGKPLSEALSVVRAAAYGIDFDDSIPRDSNWAANRVQPATPSLPRPGGTPPWRGSSTLWTRTCPGHGGHVRVYLGTLMLRVSSLDLDP